MDLANLSQLELQHIIVLCRVHRNEMVHKKLGLEEKRRLGWDGPTEEAILAAENELTLLNGLIAKLWVLEQEGFKKQ